MLEDATTQKTLKNTDSYLNDLMTRCAHIQCSFFILIHFWKALTPNLKSNIYSMYVYSGFSRQQLNYIMYQINIPVTIKEFWNVYSKLDKHDKIYIDCINADWKVLKV